MARRARLERTWLDGEKKVCPKCKKEMIEVYTAIGGFPGHPHIHPGPLCGWKCDGCGHQEKVQEESKGG